MGETPMGNSISGLNTYDFRISFVAPWNSFVYFKSVNGEISL